MLKDKERQLLLISYCERKRTLSTIYQLCPRAYYNIFEVQQG